MTQTFCLQSEGRVLKEATYINKSLSFLEQAIIALGDQKRDHIPFRQCKLTHALKDSLGKGVNRKEGLPGERLGWPYLPLGIRDPLCPGLKLVATLEE